MSSRSVSPKAFMVPIRLWSRSTIFFNTTYSMNTEIERNITGRIVPMEISSLTSPLTMS